MSRSPPERETGTVKFWSKNSWGYQSGTMAAMMRSCIGAKLTAEKISRRGVRVPSTSTGSAPRERPKRLMCGCCGGNKEGPGGSGPVFCALPISLLRLSPVERRRLPEQRSIASRRVPVTFVLRNALHQGVAIDVNLKLANVAAAVEGKESHAWQALPRRIISLSAQMLALR